VDERVAVAEKEDFLMGLKLQDVFVPLSDFTLEVSVSLDAHVTAIFGPSGSGKTTLLDVIAGLRQPVRALVRLKDRVLTDISLGICVPPHLRRIGYVPQELALFQHLSVRNNLLYGHSRHQAGSGACGFDDVIRMLDIGGLLGRRIDRLSGGEKQRVALGRALLAAPRLLLLDEPLASLDRGLKDRILPYLRRIRDSLEIPILYVSHDPREVIELCDEALVLERGRLIRRGVPGEVIAA
jgi:molybdate transport system ATP-binding protein